MLLKDTWKEIVCWIGLRLIEIMREMKRKKSLKNSSRKSLLWQRPPLWIRNFYVMNNLISNLFKENPSFMIKNSVKRNSQFLKSLKSTLKLHRTLSLKYQE